MKLVSDKPVSDKYVSDKLVCLRSVCFDMGVMEVDYQSESDETCLDTKLVEERGRFTGSSYWMDVLQFSYEITCLGPASAFHNKMILNVWYAKYRNTCTCL